MASWENMWQFFVICLSSCLIVSAQKTTKAIKLTEETWTDLLEGEWLVKFYAPWCPACKAMTSTWESVASWSADLDIKVGDIDITENPGLSGRFLVTALPTIYHVKDGEFRQYRGSREENEFISFVDEKKWKDVAPVGWYTHPAGAHMGALSWFFRLSVSIRDLHNTMTEEYGIPVWGSYVIFALVTILAGLILGLMVVCMCDMVYPPKYAPPTPQQYSSIKRDQMKGKENEDSESDVIEDDRYDAVDATGGDMERPKSARRRVPKAD